MSQECLDSEKRERIEAVLDRIRPFLTADGIAVTLVEIRDEGATVSLKGAVCQSAPLNFQMGLEQALRAEIAGFGDLRVT